MSLLPSPPDDGELAAWPPTLLVRGPGGDTDEHAHHTMHVVVAREGRLRATASGVEVEAPGVWIAPDTGHRIHAAGLDVAMLFVDPESREGRTLRRLTDQPIVILDEAARASLLPHWPRQPGAGRDEVFASAVFAGLGVHRDAASPVVHPAVRRALRRMREAELPPSLEELAEAAGLSQGRLLHVFTDEVGIPPRRYLLWLKVQRAGRALARGASLTEAAYAGGFSDGAHLSRTFRRMFGTTPSDLARNSQFVQAR